jgi:hypothetical protein
LQLQNHEARSLTLLTSFIPHSSPSEKYPRQSPLLVLMQKQRSNLIRGRFLVWLQQMMMRELVDLMWGWEAWGRLVAHTFSSMVHKMKPLMSMPRWACSKLTSAVSGPWIVGSLLRSIDLLLMLWF